MPGPEADAVSVGRCLTSPALEHEVAGAVVAAGLVPGEGVQRQPLPAAGGRVALSYREFLDAVERLREVDFPIERDPEAAWPDFVGWRVTYEQVAYAVAAEVEAVPARWLGPRRTGDPAIPPTRPAVGHPLRAPDPGGASVRMGFLAVTPALRPASVQGGCWR